MDCHKREQCNLDVMLLENAGESETCQNIYLCIFMNICLYIVKMLLVQVINDMLLQQLKMTCTEAGSLTLASVT